MNVVQKSTKRKFLVAGRVRMSFEPTNFPTLLSLLRQTFASNLNVFLNLTPGAFKFIFCLFLAKSLLSSALFADNLLCIVLVAYFSASARYYLTIVQELAPKLYIRLVFVV